MIVSNNTSFEQSSEYESNGRKIIYISNPKEQHPAAQISQKSMQTQGVMLKNIWAAIGSSISSILNIGFQIWVFIELALDMSTPDSFELTAPLMITCVWGIMISVLVLLCSLSNDYNLYQYIMHYMLITIYILLVLTPIMLLLLLIAKLTIGGAVVTFLFWVVIIDCGLQFATLLFGVYLWKADITSNRAYIQVATYL